MISWHKPGQKVAVIGQGWRCLQDGSFNDGLAEGSVVTIEAVCLRSYGVGFLIVEAPDAYHDAARFRPVYPTIIDQLRTLPSPTPERVKEDA